MRRPTAAPAPGTTATSTGPAPRTASSSGAAATCGGCASYELWSRVTTRAGAAALAGGEPAIVSAVRLARRRGDRARSSRCSRRRCSSRSCTTPRARTVHTAPRRRRSCAASRSTTCRETAGTTSATTFSSTATARSTRAAAAASTRNVIGAHAEGFNTGTVGVALIGNFTTATPPPAHAGRAREAARLAPRRRAHRPALDGRRTPRAATPSSRRARSVTLRAISGHRDTGPERVPRQRRLRAAPGDRQARRADRPAEALLADRRRARSAAPVRFQARALVGAAWTVTDHRPAGQDRRAGAGTRHARRLDVERRRPPRKGRFTWTIAAPGALACDRHARRPAGRVPPASRSRSRTWQRLPGRRSRRHADGTGGCATVDVHARRAAHSSTAQVLDAGRRPRALGSAARAAAGREQRLRLESAASAARRPLSPRRHRDRRGTTSVTQGRSTSLVDRTLTGARRVAAGRISPNGDGIADTVDVLLPARPGRPGAARRRAGRRRHRDAVPGRARAGAQHTLDWDGTADGVPLPDGSVRRRGHGHRRARGRRSCRCPSRSTRRPPTLTLRRRRKR